MKNDRKQIGPTISQLNCERTERRRRRWQKNEIFKNSTTTIAIEQLILVVHSFFLFFVNHWRFGLPLWNRDSEIPKKKVFIIWNKNFFFFFKLFYSCMRDAWMCTFYFKQFDYIMKKKKITQTTNAPDIQDIHLTSSWLVWSPLFHSHFIWFHLFLFFVWLQAAWRMANTIQRLNRNGPNEKWNKMNEIAAHSINRHNIYFAISFSFNEFYAHGAVGIRHSAFGIFFLGFKTVLWLGYWIGLWFMVAYAYRTLYRFGWLTTYPDGKSDEKCI